MNCYDERTTRTELSKIVMIGMSKIDQIVNKLCDDCVTPQIYVEQPEIVPARMMTAQETLRFRQQIYAAQSNFTDPFAQQRSAGQANLGMLGSVF